MKKALLCVLVILLCQCALCEDIALNDLSNDQLLLLQEKLVVELTNREMTEWELIGSGTFTGGIELAEGSYTIICVKTSSGRIELRNENGDLEFRDHSFKDGYVATLTLGTNWKLQLNNGVYYIRKMVSRYAP